MRKMRNPGVEKLNEAKERKEIVKQAVWKIVCGVEGWDVSNGSRGVRGH